MMRHMWVMRLLKLGIGFLLEKLVLYLAENSNNRKKNKTHKWEVAQSLRVHALQIPQSAALLPSWVFRLCVVVWYKHYAWCWRSGHPKVEGKWSHAKEPQQQPPSSLSGTPRFSSSLNWSSAACEPSVPHRTSLCAHWPGFLYHKSHKRKCGFSSCSEDGLQTGYHPWKCSRELSGLISGIC